MVAERSGNETVSENRVRPQNGKDASLNREKRRTMPQIFAPALARMRAQAGDWLAPEPFQEYVARHGFKVRGTAPYISIQSFADLSRELAAERTMVFRLGASSGRRHTDFALARAVDGWNDYFLFDEELFAGQSPQELPVDWQSERLFPFLTIPKLTETSHVNLALAAGVLAAALDLDPSAVSIPATGKGAYSFTVRPHDRLTAAWPHRAGQVEIDSVFTTSKAGCKTLFVIEAKAGRRLSSLPKYKLVYPLLAVADRIPAEFEIVPVYLRIIETPSFFRFHIAACHFPDPRRTQTFVNQLEISYVKVIDLTKSS
jgi:hypothetical protein